MGYYSKTVAMNKVVDELVANMKAEGWTETVIPTRCSPQMNTLTVGSYTISSSTQYGGNYTYYAFDGKVDSYSWWANAPTGWLKMDFGSGKIIDSYHIVHNNDTVTGAPKTWTFEGSNDNTNWTVLDTRTNEPVWVNYERRVYAFNNSTAYRYYRINVSANQGYGYLIIGELELCEPAVTSLATGNYESVMTSAGNSGTDNIVIILNRGSSKDSSGNHLLLGYAESYDNATKKFVNRYERYYYFAANTNINTNNTTILTTYYQDVSKDRLFFATVLDPSASYNANNACFLGLMKRFSAETNNSAVGLGFGFQSPTSSGNLVCLKNKQGTLNSNYATKSISHSYSPSVWGDVIFISPIFLEGTYEGMRGELEGVYTCRAENIVNEDEVIVGSVKYKAIVISTYGNNSFPNTPVLFKMPAV